MFLDCPGWRSHYSCSRSSRLGRRAGALLPPIGDGEQHDGLLCAHERHIHNEIALALQLDHIPLLQRPHVGVAQSCCLPPLQGAVIAVSPLAADV